jgi:hypothetical protein
MATKKTQAPAEPKTGQKQANVAPATEFDPSGAPVQTVADVDPSHPAVDDNPRANTTEEQNRIDFNDPTISGQEAVEKSLKQQGK